MMGQKTVVKKSAYNGVQVLGRAVAILMALEGRRDGLSVLELASATQLPRPTVQRIALSLSHTGLLVQLQDGKRFALGSQLIRLASSVHIDVVSVAQPVLDQLSRQLKETVNLLVREGRFAVCIGQSRYEQELQVVPRLGARLPLHASASGKAILASMVEEQAKRLLGTGAYKRLTPCTKTAWSELVLDLDQARITGLTYDQEECLQGVSAVSCSFGSTSGRVHALTMPMPVHRFQAKCEAAETALLHCREVLEESFR